MHLQKFWLSMESNKGGVASYQGPAMSQKGLFVQIKIKNSLTFAYNLMLIIWYDLFLTQLWKICSPTLLIHQTYIFKHK